MDINASVQFILEIEGDPDSDMSDRDKVTRSLLAEILDFEVESAKVTSEEGSVPMGAKGDPVTVGALAVAVLPALLPSLILLIQNWVLRQQNQKIRIKVGSNELEVPLNITSGEIENLIAILRSSSGKTPSK